MTLAARSPLAFCVLLSLAVPACSEDDEGSPGAACGQSGAGGGGGGAALGDACAISTDCQASFVCALGTCHSQCETALDCPAGARCMVGEGPHPVCQVAAESSCAYNSDCPEGQVCDSRQTCRDQCSTDADCVTAQLCVAGSCVEDTDGGLLDGG
jgi:hypothetical protein